MHVFVTGATGFVGNAIINQLIRDHHTITCLVRPKSAKKLISYPSDRVSIIEGDIADIRTIKHHHISNYDALIHLVGIIRETPREGTTFEQMHVKATEQIIQFATEKSIPRFLHMSALGARPACISLYHHTKGLAEELVKSSGLAWTIFRPSIIFGPKDPFTNQLAQLIARNPIVPVPGNGLYKLQPVGLQNIADGFVRSLLSNESIGQIYDVGGLRSYTYNRILDIVGEAIGKKKVRKLHIPVPILKPIVAAFEGIPAFPLTTSQLTMLLDGSTCDSDKFFNAFKMDPIPFQEGVKLYLRKTPVKNL